MSEEEFNQAVRLNFNSLVRTAEFVLHCESAAKDAVQQALVHIWKNIDSFDPTKGAFVTLLHVSVRRQAIGHLRSRIRRVAAMEFFWGETIVAERHCDDPRLDGLLAALGELPEKKRALIQKRFFEGKKVGVIAEEMGLSKSATQGRLRNAEGALLQCFKSSLERNLHIPWGLLYKASTG